MRKMRENMIRMITAACTLLLLAMTPCVMTTRAASDDGFYVRDDADLLTDAEETQLASRLRAISFAHACDVAVYTTEADVLDADFDAFCAEYYESAGYGADGALYTIGMGHRTWDLYLQGKCVEALSARLAQSIPPQHLEEAKNAIKARFVQQLQAEGLTPDQFLARSGTSAMQLEAMFDRQAQQMAEGDAALSAVAHERKLKVDEMEYGRLLGLAPDALNQVMEQARAAGQLDDLREAALRAKAAQLVVAECACTYNHETAAQAEARIRQYRQMEQMFAERFEKDEPTQEQEPPTSNGNGFKLV